MNNTNTVNKRTNDKIAASLDVESLFTNVSVKEIITGRQIKLPAVILKERK